MDGITNATNIPAPTQPNNAVPVLKALVAAFAGYGLGRTIDVITGNNTNLPMDTIFAGAFAGLGLAHGTSVYNRKMKDFKIEQALYNINSKPIIKQNIIALVKTIFNFETVGELKNNLPIVIGRVNAIQKLTSADQSKLNTHEYRGLVLRDYLEDLESFLSTLANYKNLNQQGQKELKDSILLKLLADKSETDIFTISDVFPKNRDKMLQLAKKLQSKTFASMLTNITVPGAANKDFFSIKDINTIKDISYDFIADLKIHRLTAALNEHKVQISIDPEKIVEFFDDIPNSQLD